MDQTVGSFALAGALSRRDAAERVDARFGPFESHPRSVMGSCFERCYYFASNLPSRLLQI